jgi:phosphatidylserine decarboxylase
MTLTKFGIREWLTATVIAVAAAAILVFSAFCFNLPWLNSGCILIFILWIAAVGFFRNPRRSIPRDESAILSPADGTVKDIGIVEYPEAPFNGKALRIGIFLSVFNVHLNRAPAKWQITEKNYRPGRYLDARDSNCAKENEAMTLGGTAEICGQSFPMAVRQISGAIARRIVCPPEPGCSFEKGEIYGMIKFGSRTELYLPAGGFNAEVAIGDKVTAGITVMARPVQKD